MTTEEIEKHIVELIGLRSIAEIKYKDEYRLVAPITFGTIKGSKKLRAIQVYSLQQQEQPRTEDFRLFDLDKIQDFGITTQDFETGESYQYLTKDFEQVIACVVSR